jgi:hypothetical protein
MTLSWVKWVEVTRTALIRKKKSRTVDVFNNGKQHAFFSSNQSGKIGWICRNQHNGSGSQS